MSFGGGKLRRDLKREVEWGETNGCNDRAMIMRCWRRRRWVEKKEEMMKPWERKEEKGA